MGLVVSLFRLASAAIILSFVIIVVYQLASGAISTKGLLHEKYAPAAGAVSPGRVQMLATTLVAVVIYVQRVLADHASCTLPDFPHALLPFVGMSHLVYMTGKAWRVFTNDPRMRAQSRREP